MPAGGYPLVIYFHGSGGVSRQRHRRRRPRRSAGSLAGRGARAAWLRGRGPGAAHQPGARAGREGHRLHQREQPGRHARHVPAGHPRVADVPRGAARACTSRRRCSRAAPAPRFPPAKTPTTSPTTRTRRASRWVECTRISSSASEQRIKLAVPTGAGGLLGVLHPEDVDRAGRGRPRRAAPPHDREALVPASRAADRGDRARADRSDGERGARRASSAAGSSRAADLRAGRARWTRTSRPSIYDAMDLAYAHPRVGDEIWPTMRDAQKLVGLDTPLTYPVKANLKSVDGSRTPARSCSTRPTATTATPSTASTTPSSTSTAGDLRRGAGIRAITWRVRRDADLGPPSGVTRTLPLEIYLQRESDPNTAVALSLLLVAVAAVVVVALGSRQIRGTSAW